MTEPMTDLTRVDLSPERASELTPAPPPAGIPTA